MGRPLAEWPNKGRGREWTTIVLDRLVDLFVQFLHLFRFWAVVDQWEDGIVMTLGRERKKVKKGLNFVWPLGIDHVLTEAVYRRPAVLQSQSLTTADGVPVIITPIVFFRIKNARRLILKSGGHEEAIMAIVPGIVTGHVAGANWTDLAGDEFRQAVTSDSREAAREWGIDVIEVTWKDLVRTRTYRLIAEQNHQ